MEHFSEINSLQRQLKNQEDVCKGIRNKLRDRKQRVEDAMRAQEKTTLSDGTLRAVLKIVKKQVPLSKQDKIEKQREWFSNNGLGSVSINVVKSMNECAKGNVIEVPKLWLQQTKKK